MSPDQRLPADLAERIGASRLEFRRYCSLDPNAAEDLEGEQSWSVTLRESGRDESYAELEAHRLPLGCGEDLAGHADYHQRANPEAVLAVVDGDQLRPEVDELVVRAPDVRGVTTILVLDLPVVDPQWSAVGVEELFLSRVLDDLQSDSDALVAVQLSDPRDEADERSASVLRWASVFSTLGFAAVEHEDPDLPEDVWVLSDWALLAEADRRLRERFGFEPSPS